MTLVPRRLAHSVLLLSLWTIAIHSLSATPSEDLPPLPMIEGVDKVIHGALYFPAGFWGCHIASRFFKTPTAMVCATAWGALNGWIDERTQENVPGRDSDPMDLWADVVGCLLGAWVLRLRVQKAEHRKRKSEL